MSDYHKLVLSFFRAYFKRMPGKTIEYRSYSKFSADVFLHELYQELNKGIIDNSQDKQCNLLSNIFQNKLAHHAPLKTKRARSNQAKLMKKEPSKSTMSRSRCKYLKWPSRENFLAYKKAKKPLQLFKQKKPKKKATEKEIMGSEKFWNTVKR